MRANYKHAGEVVKVNRMLVEQNKIFYNTVHMLFSGPIRLIKIDDKASYLMVPVRPFASIFFFFPVYYVGLIFAYIVLLLAFLLRYKVKGFLFPASSRTVLNFLLQKGMIK